MKPFRVCPNVYLLIDLKVGLNCLYRRRRRRRYLPLNGIDNAVFQTLLVHRVFFFLSLTLICFHFIFLDKIKEIKKKKRNTIKYSRVFFFFFLVFCLRIIIRQVRACVF